MKPDDTLGGHQYAQAPEFPEFTGENTDTYYVKGRVPSTRHGGSKSFIYEFVVFRDEDKVVINGAEILNKVCARMRWKYLITEGWKQTHE